MPAKNKTKPMSEKLSVADIVFAVADMV